MSPSTTRDPLSPLEHEVMAIVWQRQEATAEEIVVALRRPLKNATVRTLLRRLESKGYVRHSAEGRAFVYAAGRTLRRNLKKGRPRGQPPNQTVIFAAGRLNPD